jgi:Na+:H+ antiporter, NhaA family
MSSAGRSTATQIRLPWSRSDRPVARRFARPLQAFLEEESSGGVILLAAAIVALGWANSPFRGGYESLWATDITIRLGRWGIGQDLRHWVNDGLMSLFFLVVGLEIKRELVSGELRDARTAALPVLAALGGMVVPAVLFLALNASGEGARGWGIPMATDIAFALGVLTLAARRAPAGMKPFLLTLAIVDDIGAIAVIAIYYSGNVEYPALLVAAGLCVLMFGLQQIGVRWAFVYVVLGLVVWIAAYESGVHPTIAGVALGLLTPAVPFQRPRAVSDEAHRVADETVDDPQPPDADEHHWLTLASLSREAVSPLARVEGMLHPWTSNVIVPAFALANTGVRLTGESLSDAATSPIALGIVLGLVVGKLAGVFLATTAAVRLGIGRLPRGVAWRHVIALGAVAGIGFTVSIFIADLAFTARAQIDAARIGILAASVLAGVLGWILLRLPPLSPGAGTSQEEPGR